VAVKFQVPRKALFVRFVLNPWGRAFIVAAAMAVTLILSLATYLHVKYSHLVEEKLRMGAFASTSMLFAAPQAIAVGDAGSPAELAAMLRRSGYSESPSAAMGYYNLRPDAIDIYPGPESYFRREPGVIKFEKGRVSKIISLQDNTEVTQYMLEPELITNLFDRKREKRRIVHFNEISPVERIDPCLDLRAQRSEFQGILSPPLPQNAQRVTHRLTGILVLACLYNTFDEGILLGSQADVAGRHVRFLLQ